MPYIRLLKSDYTYAELSTSLSPSIEKALEERQAPCTLIVNFFSADSITVGVLEDPEKSLNLDFCREKGILVRRRQNPGGAVFANEGSAMICLYLDLDKPWVSFQNIREAFPFYLERMSLAINAVFGLDTRYRPVNDIEVRGRKLIATSARLENRVLTLRSVINVVPADRDVMCEAIIARPEKFQDKTCKNGGSRFTCFQEELGRLIQKSEIEEMVIRTMRDVFGSDTEIVEGELSPLEMNYLNAYQQKFSSEQWYYANSERVRFANASPSAKKIEAFHKAPAGLMGIVLLVHEGVVHDVILLADFHPSPFSVMNHIENALRGQPLDTDTLVNSIKQQLDIPGVEIPGTELSDFAALLDKAFKQVEG